MQPRSVSTVEQGGTVHARSSQAEQSPWVRVLERFALCAFVVQLARAVWHIAQALAQSGQGLMNSAALTAGFLVSWLLADALSGLIHYFGDRANLLNWPIIGTGFIRPFREHHVDPSAILQHDLGERLGSHAFGALPLVTVAIEICKRHGSQQAAHLFLIVLVTSLAFWVVLTGQIHVWAHAPRTNSGHGVRWAQAVGLFLSPEQHQRHHHAAHDSHYCITSGFWDRLLDALRPPCDEGQRPDGASVR